MSAAAHLLRRRSSFLLQRRHKIHAFSVPSLVTPVQSRNPLPTPVIGHRKFSATATSKPSGSSSASGSKALKYTTAGAAILLLSSAAWYTTRDEYPQQVQHVGLPQIFHGRFQEEKIPSQIDEKALNFVESNQVHENPGVNKEVANETGKVISHEHTDEGKAVHEQTDEGQQLLEQTDEGQPQPLVEQTDEGQPLHELVNDSLVPKEGIETGEGLVEKTTPEPPDDTEQHPAVSEHDSRAQEGPEEGISSKTSDQERFVSSKETEQELAPPSDENEVEDSQSALETLVDGVKETVSVVKDYLFNEANDVSEERDEVIDTGNDPSDDMFTIREQLRGEFPEMFISDSDTDDRDETPHKDEEEFEKEPELLEILESGSHEYIGAHRVPSRLSVSYLVQRGHEDSVRRYSEKEKEGEIQDIVETGESIREEEHLKEEHTKEEENVAKEKSNVVGVDVLVGAIHTAKQLQAEVDGRTFQEQLQKIQEAHKRELKDYQAKILSYAEGTDQLEKELKKEKEEAAAALKLQEQFLKKEKEEAAAALKLQEQKAEERLTNELKQKEDKATEEIERLQLLGKAQAAASLTREKADHLEDIFAVQQEVDALRTAFYTRSKEARVSHTAHKLAMGAFALEDAIERGEAIEKEAILLVTSAGGPGVDPLVDAVVSSLPSEVLTVGVGTRVQLHQKFTRLKGSLRELALMPSGGGGVFAHFLARVTANIKIGEQGSDTVGSEGIEVIIGKVERLLADEKLVEAAAVLEIGARGTAAEDLAFEWAKQARNRAIIEQGLHVLRAHVISVASGLS